MFPRGAVLSASHPQMNFCPNSLSASTARTRRDILFFRSVATNRHWKIQSRKLQITCIEIEPALQLRASSFGGAPLAVAPLALVNFHTLPPCTQCCKTWTCDVFLHTRHLCTQCESMHAHKYTCNKDMCVTTYAYASHTMLLQRTDQEAPNPYANPRR